MTKVQITIDLEEYESKKQAIDFLQGDKWKIVFHELDDFLRHKIKYEEITEEQYESFSLVREKLSDIVGEKGLDIYD